MNKSSVTVQMGVAILLVCLWGVCVADNSPLSREKRGFRQSSASRVAHGYGKRGIPVLTPGEQLSLQQLETSAFSDDIADGPLMTVSEFAELIGTHPKLARALLKKFVDIDGDDVISTEELFRPVMRK